MKDDRRRVPIPIPPCPPGLSLEKTEQALIAVCQPLWDAGKIPVIQWGGPDDGLELLPPRWN